ncbi:hypothetical protein RHGRI_008119 [Rhododendron griersonianum]|uniref:Uncharacterized protein n=1 Tax=Rhododendron griersonianum TaxID=479676 RepID=A0AAV6KZ81_9ERIC|nr:hypothetical protein RHGRI_008119 [Rhododendron griersonianum]
MEYCDNRREETIQKKKNKRSAKDDDELPHGKKLGSSDDGFAFSTLRVTRSASKQQQQQHGEGKEQKKPGFDVGEVPEDVFMAIILPCPLDEPASALRPYNKMAKKALAAYNNEKAKDKKAGSQNF